jgi:predicted DNA-binding transcriptional regulator YafY
MAKRSDALDTAILLVEILKRIPKRYKVTAPELQKQLANEGFERDLRTIQRHLDTLAEYFELERDDTSKPFGYRWLERAKGISLPSLTPQESLLMTLAEQHLRALLPVKLMKSMDGFFTQSRRNLLLDPLAKKERQWAKRVRVVATSQPLLPPAIKTDVLDEVTTALYENRVLEVDYQNAIGERKKARVWPLGLAQQGTRLYLVSRFEGYDNERSLALHRFHKAQALDERFPYPADFDLEKFDDAGRFGFGEGKQISLHFRINKDAGFHITESPLSEDQLVVEHDNCYEITATVVDSAMLTWWLRGFGDGVWDIRRTRI